MRYFGVDVKTVKRRDQSGFVLEARTGKIEISESDYYEVEYVELQDSTLYK